MYLQDPRLHRIRNLELTYKLFFLLRDLGLESAKDVAIEVWSDYVHVVGQLALSEMADSQ